MTRQMSLTTTWADLTTEELVTRGKQLADQLHTRRLVLEEHVERKKAMREELLLIEREIVHLEDALRTGKEERPIAPLTITRAHND